MKEQIINILEENAKNWQFTDMRIKLSPHTPPIIINEISKEENGWMLKWNSGYGPASMLLSEVEHRETLATIYQRLKIITNASRVTDQKS